MQIENPVRKDSMFGKMNAAEAKGPYLCTRAHHGAHGNAARTLLDIEWLSGQNLQGLG